MTRKATNTTAHRYVAPGSDEYGLTIEEAMLTIGADAYLRDIRLIGGLLRRAFLRGMAPQVARDWTVQQACDVWSLPAFIGQRVVRAISETAVSLDRICDPLPTVHQLYPLDAQS